MLQEAFDLPSTQILSLYALGNYLATRPELSVSDATAENTPCTLVLYFASVWAEVAQRFGSLIE